MKMLILDYIAKVGKKYLVVPAIGVPSEKLFINYIGKIINEIRKGFTKA